MAVISQDDLIDSVADALQYISYYPPAGLHPRYGGCLPARGVAGRQGGARASARQLAAVRLGQAADLPRHRHRHRLLWRSAWRFRGKPTWAWRTWSTKACGAPTPSRTTCCAARCLPTPDGARANTRDNTPAVIHTRVVPGSRLRVEVAAKGGGSEAKAMFKMLNPSDSIQDWILSAVPQMGAGWCPPGVLGVGIGGTPEKAMLLAKEAMMAPIDIHDLQARGPANHAEQLRLELFEKVNALGIGAQGLGGLTTVLDVKVLEYPTHAANKPVAIIPNCAATRHLHFELDGSGPATFDPPELFRLARHRLQARHRRPPRGLEHGDPRRRANLAGRRDDPPLRQDAHRSRCRSQTADRPD